MTVRIQKRSDETGHEELTVVMVLIASETVTTVALHLTHNKRKTATVSRFINNI